MGNVDCQRRRRVRRCAAVVLVAFALPAGAFAQTVSIEPGARWSVGDAVVDLDCAAVNVAGALDAQDGRVDGIGDLDIAGQVTATTAALEVGGNWNNHGSFVAGTGTVRLSDRCDQAAASIRGTTTYSTLRIDSARAKAYRFEAGTTQSVAQALQLTGAAGQYLAIGSTQAGTRAGLALSTGGTQQIAWVNVADMAAPEGSAWLAPGRPEDFHSVDSGNNLRWFQTAEPAQPAQVPTTSGGALLVLLLGLGLLGRHRLRRQLTP
jgi:hypothetical protein